MSGPSTAAGGRVRAVRASAGRSNAELARIAVVVAACIVALVGALAVDRDRTWGWDESMHAELPAARIALALRAGELGAAAHAVVECEQYPFVYPVVLGAVQTVTGVSEIACRRTGRVLWALAWLGLWFVFEELRRLGLAHAARAATFALVLALASPLAMAYSGTLFLEGASVCASVWALRAWLARKGALAPRAELVRDLAAGAWLALAFFVKFNYGLLLALGCALDFAWDAAGSARAGRGREVARRALALAAVPLAACAWWFALPLPGGFELGASHRAAFAGFLAGNREGAAVAWNLRAIDWITALGPNLSASFVVAAGFALGLTAVLRPPVRTLGLVLAAFAVPIALHPFHLDRFLWPVLVPVWCLAGVGLSRSFGRTGLFLAILCLSVPVGMLGNERLLRALGLWNVALGDYIRVQIAEKQNPLPTRSLPTAGLLRSEADALFALAAREAGPDARVGWIGTSSELAPAALHLALLERGGSRARFLRDAHRPLDVTFEGVDPQWSAAQLGAWAAQFDVIFATDPPDPGDRPERRFEARYREMLVRDLGWSETELGSVTIHKGARAPYPVRLFACRPPKP